MGAAIFVYILIIVAAIIISWSKKLRKRRKRNLGLEFLKAPWILMYIWARVVSLHPVITKIEII